MGTARPSIVRDTMMTPLLPFLILGLAGVRTETSLPCSKHIMDHCDDSIDSVWTGTTCNSKFGGFEGISNDLHKIIRDDFSDSMTYLVMSSSFSTDEKNRMGFSKYFREYSDKMWSRGKDMMKYVLKRGGHLGSGFQVPLYSSDGQTSGGQTSLDYSTELKSLGVTLDLLKARAKQLYAAHKHSLNSISTSTTFDTDTAHMLEEVSESFTEDINDVARKLNTLAKIVKKSASMGLHMFDQSLM